MSYPVGSRPTVSFQFNDETGAFVDPGDVTVQLERPDGHLTTLTYSGNQVTKDDVGRYHIDFDTTGYPGLWVARAYTPVGSGQAATPDQYIRITGTGVAGGTVRTEPYLSVSEFREHVKSALPDAALQRLLDANSLAIDERAGPIGPETLVLYPARQTLLFLDRPVGTVTSVTEFFNDPVGISGVVLDSTDYRLQSAGTILERWGYGSHPADWWSDRVELVYLPVDDTAERIRVLIKLVELDLNRQPGLSGVRMGEYAEQQRGEAYDDEREAILASLVPNALTFA